MNSNIEAIPASSSGIMDSFQRLIEKPAVKQVTTRQSLIASLHNAESWQALCETIDLWLEDLRQLPVDPLKDDVTSVGFRYLASRIAIEYLTTLKDMPERYKKLSELENETA